MSDLIVVSVDGLDKIQAKLAKLPDAVADDGVDAANAYLLKVLKINAPKNFVTRAQAYPGSYATSPLGKKIQGFQSWAQFKYVCYLYGSNQVPYKRTQELSKSWKTVGNGRLSFLANEADGAEWVIGDKQSNHERLVGWKRVSVTLKEHTTRLVKAFDGAVKKAIRRVGL